jgi:hypothetical protein
MKIAVMVTDATQAIHCNGGVCEQTVHIFPMPDSIEKFITEMRAKKGYGNLSLGLAEDHSEPKEPK